MKITLSLLLALVTFAVSAQWNSSGSNIYFNSGNVGIGTTSPSYKLDISGPTRAYGELRVNGVGDGNGLYADDGWGSIIFSITRRPGNEARFQSYGYHTFYSGGNGGTERMRIAADGNVGIGTASPLSQFHLASNSDHAFKITRQSGSYGFQILRNATQGRIYFQNTDDNNNFGTRIQIEEGGTGWQNLILNPTAGNVGIGTTSPVGKLDINYAGGQLRLSGGTVAGGVWTNNTDLLYLADWNTGLKGLNVNMTNGTVSIGTNSGTVNGYGAALSFLGADSNGDHLHISRYNNGSNQSELRVNIGDDYGQAQDMFVVGTHYWQNGNWYPHMAVQASGRVGIGTTSPDEKLTVKGKIHAEEVRVDLNVPGPDYVFENDYDLLSLSEIESYIRANKHLPEVPSAKEMEENGLNLKEMNLLLLKKVEELTLHLIKIEKKSVQQQMEIEQLKLQKK
jgi:hypothetical protein